MRSFPKDLARVVAERWDNLVAGDYEAPPCPPEAMLQELLEIAYLAGEVPEETRYSKFNLVAVPAADEVWRGRIRNRWPLNEPRPLSTDELRRLAPSVDIKKSAIWVEWTEDRWQVAGLVDLGTSWHRARMGLEYRYEHPSCLLVQVDGPGRLRVYQGGYRLARLTNGQIDGHKGIELHLSLHPTVNAGLVAMSKDLVRPEIEYVQEFAEFEFIALCNTFAGIANSISFDGHGGAIVIVPAGEVHPLRELKVKYPQCSVALRSAFITFMNARHEFVDLVEEIEQEGIEPPDRLAGLELENRRAYSNLVEATRFVAHLADCDGAIVVSEDLVVLGFGCEISAELKPGTNLFEVKDGIHREGGALDIEQFGMRHRSAIKLVCQESEYRVLVISQDGPISAVWSDEGDVLMQKGVNLVNLNMPWA